MRGRDGVGAPAAAANFLGRTSRWAMVLCCLPKRAVGVTVDGSNTLQGAALLAMAPDRRVYCPTHESACGCFGQFARVPCLHAPVYDDLAKHYDITQRKTLLTSREAYRHSQGGQAGSAASPAREQAVLLLTQHLAEQSTVKVLKGLM